MSIINQALKKAQREQRVHSLQSWCLPTQAASLWPQRSMWFVLTLGGSIALGIGALLHAWLIPASTPPPAAMPVTVLPTLSLMSKPPLSTSPPATTAALHPLVGQGTASGLSSKAVAAIQPESTPLPWHQPAETAAQSTTIVGSPEPQPLLAQKPAETAARPGAPTLPTTPQPTAAHTLFNLALEAQATGDLEQAMTLLQQAVKIAPTLKQAYNGLGNLYYQRQQYDDAVAMYRQALALDPNYTQARNNLGSAYMQLSQHERAIEELQKVLQDDGEASLAYYNLACVYARTGDSAQALHYLQRAMEIEPQARLWAQTDADFNRVRNEPAFQQLLGSS